MKEKNLNNKWEDFAINDGLFHLKAECVACKQLHLIYGYINKPIKRELSCSKCKIRFRIDTNNEINKMVTWE